MTHFQDQFLKEPVYTSSILEKSQWRDFPCVPNTGMPLLGFVSDYSDLYVGRDYTNIFWKSK